MNQLNFCPEEDVCKRKIPTVLGWVSNDKEPAGKQCGKNIYASSAFVTIRKAVRFGLNE